MEAFWTTLAVVALVELTDRTRLVAMFLSARYRTPIQLIVGMSLGYVPAVALAVWGSGFVSAALPAGVLNGIAAATFIGFGIFFLRIGNGGGHEESLTEKWMKRLERFGPFVASFALVAVTEFADKSQIATAGLMAKYNAAWSVFLGSISAQTLLNLIYVTLGQYAGEKFPVPAIRRIAGGVFIAFGVLALIRGGCFS